MWWCRWGGWISFFTGPPIIPVKEQHPAQWLVRRPQPQKLFQMLPAWMTMLETKQNILHLSTDRWEPREEVPGECLGDLRGVNVSTWLVICKIANCFHDTCFLNCSHSVHFLLCFKEAGVPFQNPTILCRHNRATMVENKWMPVTGASEVIRSNCQNVALFRDSLCWKNFLLQIRPGVIKPLLAL